MALCQLKLCGRVKTHVIAINKFTSPFDVDVESASSEVQMELVDLQCSDELKSPFAAVGHADFRRKHILPTKRFPGLVDIAMRTVAAFGCTYCCEQLFSRMKLTK